MSTGIAGEMTRDKQLDRSSHRRMKTRDKLILAAEKLFAEEGISAVSMRRINSAANQKNVSALHYYFGSRDAIIEAIFDYRMPRAARRRNELIDEIVAANMQYNLRALVHAAIWPLAEQILSEARPNNFIRFLSQSHRLARMDSWMLVRHKNRQSLVRVYIMLIRAIDELPRAIVHSRLIMALRHAIYVLADLDNVIEKRHAELRDPMVKFHANELIDMITTALRAPLSPQTREAYENLMKHSGRTEATLFGPDTIQAVSRNTSLVDEIE